MPLVDDRYPPILGPIESLPGANAPTLPTPDFLTETLPAAFRSENTIWSWLSRENYPTKNHHGPIDMDFNPVKDIAGYEDHWRRFVYANNDDEVAAMKRQIDRERDDNAVLARSGWSGAAARFAAGTLDPVNLIPVGGTAYKTYRLGGSILTNGLVTARAGLLGSAAAEIALHSSQETRTWGESAANITVGTLLSGVLGGSVGGFRHLVETRAAGRLYDKTRQDLTGNARSPDEAVEVALGGLEKDLEKVMLDAGAVASDVNGNPVLRQNGEHKLAHNYGIAKVIVKHGVEGPDAKDPALAGYVVTRDDVTAIPTVMRRFETIPPAKAVGKETKEWRWAVMRKGENGEERQVIYSVRRFTSADNKDHVVTVYAPYPGNEIPLSRKRQSPLSASRLGFLGSQGDTGEGLTVSTPSRADRGAPNSNIDQSGENVTAWKNLENGLERDLTVPHPDSPDPLEPGFIKANPDDLIIDNGSRAGGEIADEGDLPDAAKPTKIGEGGAAGAAAVNDPATTMEERIKSAFGLEKMVKFQDPLFRAVTSPSVATRRIAQELAESPLYFEKNALGVASPVAAETRIKAYDGPLAKALRRMDDLFVKHRLGRSRKMGDAAGIGASDLTGKTSGENMLTNDQFRMEIGRAMRRGDRHDIPEVAEAAKAFRDNVYDPLKNDAIEQGVYPEDLSVNTAETYLNRVYDNEKIVARRSEFISIVARWLKERQQARAAIQKDLERLLNGETTLSKVERKKGAALERAGKSATRAAAKLEEARRQLGEEVSRSFDQQDRLKAAEAGKDAGTAARTRIKGRETASRIAALRKRVAALGDQSSGKAAKRDALDRYIADLRKRHDATIDDITHALKEWGGRRIPTGVEGAKRALRAATDRDDQELFDLAGEICDRILSTPDGRLPYDAHKAPETRFGKNDLFGREAPRSALAARVFAIPDALIEDFLESDIERLSKSYVHTLAPDLELMRSFGTVDMTDQIKEIVRDYDRKIAAATSEAERRTLDKQKKRDITDIAGMRDRIRGTYALPKDPDGVLLRANRVVRDVNYTSKLGGMLLASIMDTVRLGMAHGLRPVLEDGLVPMIGNFRRFRLAAEEAKESAVGLDMIMDSRAMSIGEVMDDYRRHTKFERGMRSLANRFGLATLMSPWNAAMKQFRAAVTMSQILKAARNLRAGRLKQEKIEYLAHNYIDADMARRIADQFDRFGDDSESLFLANTASWTDRGAAETFRAAVLKDADKAIVTPGQDKPLWMSTEWGKTVGQFKSFGVASTQRVMISGLQNANMGTLMGASMMVGLGMLSYYLKSIASGYETSDDPVVWLLEGMDRSGLTGWMFDANNTAEKLFEGHVGLSVLAGGAPMSRYASRNKLGAVLGPTVGTGLDVFNVASAAIGGDMRKSDTRALFRIMPLRNVFYLRRAIFDPAEEGINAYLGIRR